MHEPSEAKLFFVKPPIVIFFNKLEAVMVGAIALNQDLSWEIAPTCPSRDLSEKVKGSFGGSEVREGQGVVGRNDTNQGDVRKVMTLGNHLSASEDVDFSFLKLM